MGERSKPLSCHSGRSGSKDPEFRLEKLFYIQILISRTAQTFDPTDKKPRIANVIVDATGDTLMKIHKTSLGEIALLEPDIFRDQRGFFMESFNDRKLKNLGIEFRGVQDNHCLSEKTGTLRGLHYQLLPAAQTKIVRVTSGVIFDVAVDIRDGSPTFGQWMGTTLSAENRMQIFVPKGFAHGYITLAPNTEVQYKVDEFYSLEHERSIAWDDPDIGIAWPLQNPILAEKDLNAPGLKNAEINFSYNGHF